MARTSGPRESIERSSSLERIVYSDYFTDPDGNIVPASYYGMDSDMPLETVVTVTFEEHDGKTTLTLQHVGMGGEDGANAKEGWSQSFEKLADYLSTF